MNLSQIIIEAYPVDLPIASCPSIQALRDLLDREFCGDTLFHFIVRELADVGAERNTQNGITALKRAQDDIQAVIDALTDI